MAASRTLLQLLLACQNLTLDLQDLFWWYILKSNFYELWQQHGEGDEWRLTWYLWWVIYTSIKTWTYSENLLPAAKAPGLMITKTVPISIRIVISYVTKQGIPFWIDRTSIETETTTWSGFLNKMRENHCRTNTSTRGKKNPQNNKTVRVTVWDPSRKVNCLSKVIWERKLLKLTRSISSTRIGYPVLMMDVEVSKYKHIGRWVEGENLIYVRWKSIKNYA